jgi:hypothetical protein
MAFIHELHADRPIEVGPYTLRIVDTSPGDDPETVTLGVDGPDVDRTVTIDRVTWYRPEPDDTTPNSPQHRRDPSQIYVSVKRRGNIGHESAELVIEAPNDVEIVAK